jgi:hypothetical protein
MTLTIEKIQEFINNKKVYKSDSLENLKIYHYSECNDDSDILLKQCRGVVCDNNSILLNTLFYNYTYSHLDVPSDVFSYLENNFNDLDLYVSEEGTLLRIFYLNNRWYTSTFKKFDAFKSKWSSRKTFGQLFIEALYQQTLTNKNLQKILGDNITVDNVYKKFLDTLSTEKQYVFLLRNDSENRVVCYSEEKPTMYYVTTIENQKLIQENININKTKQLHFKNIDEMFSYIDRNNYNLKQGVIAFAPNGYQYKILHNDYIKLFNMRGNQPSINYRYLQIRKDRVGVDMFYYLYPSHIPIFKEYEDILFQISKDIHELYMNRFVKKLWTVIDPIKFKIIKKCHEWHKSNKKKNIVTRQIVYMILTQEEPTFLNKIIKDFKYNTTKKIKNTNETTQGETTQGETAN